MFKSTTFTVASLAVVLVLSGCRSNCCDRSSQSDRCDSPSRFAALPPTRNLETRPTSYGQPIGYPVTYTPVANVSPIFAPPPGASAPGNELPFPQTTIPATNLPTAGGNVLPMPAFSAGK